MLALTTYSEGAPFYNAFGTTNFRFARRMTVNSTGIASEGFRSGIIAPNYASCFRRKTGAL